MKEVKDLRAEVDRLKSTVAHRDAELGQLRSNPNGGCIQEMQDLLEDNSREKDISRCSISEKEELQQQI